MRVKSSSIDHGRTASSATALGPVLAVLGAAAFLAVLDGTAAAASLRALGLAFDAPLPVIAWVTSGYLIAAGTALPFVGWLVDRFGGRTAFLFGLGLFVLGSVLTGLSWSVPSLIVFRVIQGFGGGLLEPAALTVAAALAPPDQVGRVTGRFSLIINIAPLVGPLLGTALGDAGLWRWIFLINLPIGALVLLGALRVVVKDVTPIRDHALPDYRGIALLGPGFAALLLTVTRWGDGGFDGGVTITAAVGLLLLGGYGVHALGAPGSPVLDLRLLRSRPFAAALGAMTGVGFTMYSMLTVLPWVLEIRWAATGTGTGIRRGMLVAALGAGLLVSMSTAARMSDTLGPRRLVVSGGLVTAVLLSLVAIGQSSWPVWSLVLLLVLTGLSFGCLAAPSFASVYRTLGAERAAQGTTALFITVQLAAATGATVVGVLLASGVSASAPLAAAAVAVLIGALCGAALPGRPSR